MWVTWAIKVTAGGLFVIIGVSLMLSSLICDILLNLEEWDEEESRIGNLVIFLMGWTVIASGLIILGTPIMILLIFLIPVISMFILAYLVELDRFIIEWKTKGIKPKIAIIFTAIFIVYMLIFSYYWFSSSPEIEGKKEEFLLKCLKALINID